jgi:magnesium-protoporphyrin O-methyltransferase
MTSGAGRFFSKNSKRYAKTFRKKGLAKEQRLLLDGILSTSPAEKTVLDIGCGIGALHLSLLGAGAASAVGVDTAEGMIAYARTLAREKGIEERTSYHIGDFVPLHDSLAAADITILDKVVCCYENVDELVGLSLDKTTAVYALTFPRPHIAVRFFFSIPIVAGKLLRWSFRPYWHDWQKMVAQIERSGFSESYAGATMLWSVKVFRRTGFSREADGRSSQQLQA